MIIEEVEVKTYGKVIKCECGSENVKIIKKDFTSGKAFIKCIKCGKEEKVDLSVFDLRYEIINNK